MLSYKCRCTVWHLWHPSPSMSYRCMARKVHRGLDVCWFDAINWEENMGVNWIASPICGIIASYQVEYPCTVWSIDAMRFARVVFRNHIHSTGQLELVLTIGFGCESWYLCSYSIPELWSTNSTQDLCSQTQTHLTCTSLDPYFKVCYWNQWYCLALIELAPLGCPRWLRLLLLIA